MIVPRWLITNASEFVAIGLHRGAIWSLTSGAWFFPEIRHNFAKSRLLTIPHFGLDNRWPSSLLTARRPSARLQSRIRKHFFREVTQADVKAEGFADTASFFTAWARIAGMEGLVKSIWIFDFSIDVPVSGRQAQSVLN
jgi:hypothetical protein